jgi:hypothetical protein
MAMLSLKSGADLSAKKGFAVKLDSSGLVVLAAAATDAIIGILEDGGSASGDPVSVAGVGEIIRASAGGTITAATHKWLTSDANGELVATTTAKDNVCAITLQTAADGDLIRVMVVNFNLPSQA